MSKVINTDEIHEEIKEYSGLTHGTEFHFIHTRYNYRKCFRSKRLLTKGLCDFCLTLVSHA